MEKTSLESVNDVQFYILVQITRFILPFQAIFSSFECIQNEASLGKKKLSGFTKSNGS